MDLEEENEILIVMQREELKLVALLVEGCSECGTLGRQARAWTWSAAGGLVKQETALSGGKERRFQNGELKTVPNIKTTRKKDGMGRGKGWSEKKEGRTKLQWQRGDSVQHAVSSKQREREHCGALE